MPENWNLVCTLCGSIIRLFHCILNLFHIIICHMRVGRSTSLPKKWWCHWLIMLKGYTSIRSGNFTLTECFKNYPVIRTKFNRLWQNLADIDTFMSIRNPTREEMKKVPRNVKNGVRYFLFFSLKKIWLEKWWKLALLCQNLSESNQVFLTLFWDWNRKVNICIKFLILWRKPTRAHIIKKIDIGWCWKSMKTKFIHPNKNKIKSVMLCLNVKCVFFNFTVQ